MAIAATTSTGFAASEAEIKFGHTVPYSGPVSFYGVVGQATVACFAKVNDDGGINARKVTVISLGDGLAPPRTVEQVRKLVEPEEVDAIVNQVATATASSVRQYRSQKGVPQLFVQSGPNSLLQPKAFRFSTSALVGLENTVGVMTAAVVKDPSDPTWQNDADHKAWLAWMEKYQPKGDVDSSANAAVYATSAAIAQVLKLAGDDLGRENILKAALTLKDFAAPMLLLAITMTMSADNYHLFRKIQLMRFDRKRWVPQVEPVGE